MSDESQRWKDKYFACLEHQEQLERHWAERLDLLRRGLVRSSLAAEGSDRAVDECMRALREVVRGEQPEQGLAALLPRLEKAVLDSERRRQQHTQQNVAALSALAEQLLQLELPREVRKGLKQFLRRVEARITEHRELPAVLAELSGLQYQALQRFEGSREARPGLLQRLFGSREGADLATAGVAEAAAPGPSAPPAGETAIVPPEAAPEATAERSPAGAATITLDSLPLDPGLLLGESAGDPAYALPAAEPGYSAIAPHVAASLRRLLDELDLPAFHRPQAEALRQRLEGGLNWYELVPALDDLAVLVLAVADGGQREFAGYLQQLNERLADFLGSLNSAQEGYADSQENVRQLDQEIRAQVGELQQSVQEATDLDGLKRSLESRLEKLLGRMAEYRQQRDRHDQALQQRLNGLVERVACMEQEAAVFRERLEQQRQKSLIDPLTGLPNRAAWNERLELEVARRRRYGGELLLAVLDVDHFKRVNDSFGHQAGDKVLKLVAAELARRLRKTDFIARYGGEEFVLLLPGTPPEGGRQLLEALRQAVEACPFHFKGERVTITFSGGLAAFVGEATAEEVFERADQALYRAKDGGRNRIELA